MMRRDKSTAGPKPRRNAKRFALDRRTMLKGMLGGALVSVGLPPLECFFDVNGRAYADCGSLPARFGWFFHGNGVLPERWVPRSEGAGWMPSDQLMPLMPLRDKISVVTGTRILTPNTVPHGSGPSGFLSGGDMVMSGGEASTGSFPGATLDQLIADAIGRDTRFRSLELGVQPTERGMSYSAVNTRNPPETSPLALYERIFGVGFREPGDMSGPDPRLALRRSVLDAVTGQTRGLRDRVSAGDRARLDQHLEGIRDIERQIARLEADPPSLAACMRPDAPLAEYPDLEGRPQMSLVTDVMGRLLAMALACDQTRVFSFMLTQPVNNVLFLDAASGHHQLTHDEPGDQPEVHRIVVHIYELFASFLRTLDGIEEGDGTLLDHTLVLGMTDVSFGRTHQLDDFPILLAGGACGAIRTGVHVRSPGDNACRVSLSILRAMGLPAAEFGAGIGRTTDGFTAIEGEG